MNYFSITVLLRMFCAKEIWSTRLILFERPIEIIQISGLQPVFWGL